MDELDETHDPARLSWVTSANTADTDFPLQNLPLGVFRQPGGEPRIGIAIGDCVLDVPAALDAGLMPDVEAYVNACRRPVLNDLLAGGRPALTLLRHVAFRLLLQGSPAEGSTERILHRLDAVELMLPMQIGDFTDFYTSIHHATRGGRIARPGTPPLFQNFRHLPVAYHGRASSVVPSGTPCIRPNGQNALSVDAGNGRVQYLPSGKLDFELEVGCYVGVGNRLGETLTINEAEASIAGVCLVNDWSARDIQRWESNPLGPFLSKSFLTSVSPWVVTLDALAPFRFPVNPRTGDEPLVSDHLTSARHEQLGALDIQLAVKLRTAAMRSEGKSAVQITQANFVTQYWTLFQMLTHHASNGCNMRTGDLLSSGTVSDPVRENAGCLFEMTLDGTDPLTLPGGETRGYLSDGDEVEFVARCEREGYRSLGFGPCRGTVMPAFNRAGHVH
jgi:fumarylacetoacetase